MFEYMYVPLNRKTEGMCEYPFTSNGKQIKAFWCWSPILGAIIFLQRERCVARIKYIVCSIRGNYTNKILLPKIEKQLARASDRWTNSDIGRTNRKRNKFSDNNMEVQLPSIWEIMTVRRTNQLYNRPTTGSLTFNGLMDYAQRKTNKNSKKR